MAKYQKLIFLTVLEVGSHDQGDGHSVPGESLLVWQMVVSWLCLHTHSELSGVSPLSRH